MPGSAAGQDGGWSGREPLTVIVARALAPWPLWLILWEVLRPEALGGAVLTPVVATLLVGLMAQRAARGADRALRLPLVAALIGLSMGATVLLEVASAFTWYGRGFVPSGAAFGTLFTWLGGAALYEGFVRTLREPELQPSPALDRLAHAILFAGPWLGLVGVDQGLPLPFVVGPLVALRLVGGHDARMPLPRRGRLTTRTVLGTVAAVALLGAVLDASPLSHAPAAVAWSVMAAACSALLAALALASRAHVAAGALSGVVHEQRDGGVVLSIAGDEGAVHVVPRSCGSGGALPQPNLTVTFLDVEHGPEPGAPYRTGPSTVRARVLWCGDADQLASTLLARAWSWLAWSAITFAAAVYLLGR